MKIKFLSSKSYHENDSNLGDCVIIDSGPEVIVYDCGCEQHAKRVIEYIKQKGLTKVKVILSHNDLDHFAGLSYLIENGYVDEVYTLLLLKYVDNILAEIDDGRRSREGLKKQITELYDNIASLSQKVTLSGIYDEDKSLVRLSTDLEFVGPDFSYMVEATAKGLDNCQGDIIDGETIVNATSVQLLIHTGKGDLLLTGDSSFKAIYKNLEGKTFIQLPHHGKAEIADEIFERLHGKNDVTYIISDNTGDSNGGSDKLNTKGHIIMNTQNGDVNIPAQRGSLERKTGRTLGGFPHAIDNL